MASLNFTFSSNPSRVLLFSSLLIVLIPAIHAASSVSSLPLPAQSLFNQSIAWLDTFFDDNVGYLHNLDAQSALHHDTRSSVWYAVGLLARDGNLGADRQNALRIIRNVVQGQYKDPSEQWFGDYQQSPEEPYVGSPAYPAKIYGSWDPNWRGFVGTTFIVMLEEFDDLIDEETRTLMVDSLRNATIGDSYRDGGVDGDNLYPAYTNPSLMRAFTTGYTGRFLNDSNMTTSAETYANQVISLFNRASTLSEFNSGTYTGVSLFALTLWSKYLPPESVMTQWGPRMIEATWRSIAQLWHPRLKNMAGPWDRAYGFDMQRYLSVMGLHLWTLIGREESSISSQARFSLFIPVLFCPITSMDFSPSPGSPCASIPIPFSDCAITVKAHKALTLQPQTMSHSPDFAYGPLLALLSQTHNSLIPPSILPTLTTFSPNANSSHERTFTSSAFSPPYDTAPRNITAWLSEEGISIGAESFDEKDVVGGPAESQETFNPAVVQWDAGRQDGVGFISVTFPSSLLCISHRSPSFPKF
ncbi:MAG: hypothetical protein Q9227_006562 [Pyrenula ochraceoflavens]